VQDTEPRCEVAVRLACDRATGKELPTEEDIEIIGSGQGRRHGHSGTSVLPKKIAAGQIEQGMQFRTTSRAKG